MNGIAQMNNVQQRRICTKIDHQQTICKAFFQQFQYLFMQLSCKYIFFIVNQIHFKKLLQKISHFFRFQEMAQGLQIRVWITILYLFMGKKIRITAVTKT
jgi:hypothetical protein